MRLDRYDRAILQCYDARWPEPAGAALRDLESKGCRPRVYLTGAGGVDHPYDRLDADFPPDRNSRSGCERGSGVPRALSRRADALALSGLTRPLTGDSAKTGGSC